MDRHVACAWWDCSLRACKDLMKIALALSSLVVLIGAHRRYVPTGIEDIQLSERSGSIALRSGFVVTSHLHSQHDQAVPCRALLSRPCVLITIVATPRIDSVYAAASTLRLLA
jgi:hypothetical protein